MEAAKGAGQDDVQQQFQARQCHLRMLSLLCYGNGPLDALAPTAMLRLMVLAQHAACFIDHPVARGQLANLLVRCKGLMAGRSGIAGAVGVVHTQPVSCRCSQALCAC